MKGLSKNASRYLAVTQENFAHGIEGIHKNAVSGAVGSGAYQYREKQRPVFRHALARRKT